MKNLVPKTEEAHSFDPVGSRLVPRWFYFDFYVLCRRQQRFPGRNLNPSLTAWNGVGAGIAMPWIILIMTINNYFPFLYALGRLWVGLHLPGEPQKTWGYALIVVALVTGIILLEVLFRGKYKKIMLEFSAYNRSNHDLAPTLVLGAVWVLIGWNSARAAIIWMSGDASVLLIATITNACALVVTEIIFRIWWRWWCEHHSTERTKTGG